MIDPIISEREILHEYQDDIIFYEQIGRHKEDSKERERNHNIDHEQQKFKGFINTNDIFSHLVYLVTKTDEIEKPEIDITESHSDRVTTDSENKKDEGGSLRDLKVDDNQVIEPRVYEARVVDDPKQGGKTSNEDQTVLEKKLYMCFKHHVVFQFY